MDYEKLRSASRDDLFQAVLLHLQQDTHFDGEKQAYFRMGFEVGGPDGWEHCAPAWLKSLEQEREANKTFTEIAQAIRRGSSQK